MGNSPIAADCRLDRHKCDTQVCCAEEDDGHVSRTIHGWHPDQSGSYTGCFMEETEEYQIPNGEKTIAHTVMGLSYGRVNGEVLPNYHLDPQASLQNTARAGTAQLSRSRDSAVFRAPDGTALDFASFHKPAVNRLQNEEKSMLSKQMWRLSPLDEGSLGEEMPPAARGKAAVNFVDPSTSSSSRSMPSLAPTSRSGSDSARAISREAPGQLGSFTVGRPTVAASATTAGLAPAAPSMPPPNGSVASTSTLTAPVRLQSGSPSPAMPPRVEVRTAREEVVRFATAQRSNSPKRWTSGASVASLARQQSSQRSAGSQAWETARVLTTQSPSSTAAATPAMTPRGNGGGANRMPSSASTAAVTPVMTPRGNSGPSRMPSSAAPSATPTLTPRCHSSASRIPTSAAPSATQALPARCVGDGVGRMPMSASRANPDDAPKVAGKAPPTPIFGVAPRPTEDLAAPPVVDPLLRVRASPLKLPGGLENERFTFGDPSSASEMPRASAARVAEGTPSLASPAFGSRPVNDTGSGARTEQLGSTMSAGDMGGIATRINGTAVPGIGGNGM